VYSGRGDQGDWLQKRLPWIHIAEPSYRSLQAGIQRLLLLAMQTRVVIFSAGPTPWDDESRLVGNHPLPLTAGAVLAIKQLLDAQPMPASSVYRPAANEACDQTAQLIAARYDLHPYDEPQLEAVRFGLWQGLTRDELGHRFGKVFTQWKNRPLTVTPPDGEPLPDAITRIGDALKRILRRNRGVTVTLALRPMAMQIAIGVLQRQSPRQIAEHLHESPPTATLELDLAALRQFIR